MTIGRRRLDDVAGSHDQGQARRPQDLAAEIADAIAHAHAAAAQPGLNETVTIRRQRRLNGPPYPSDVIRLPDEPVFSQLLVR
jgi:hypothetical protein